MTRLSVLASVAVAASFVVATPMHDILRGRNHQIDRRWNWDLDWKSWFDLGPTTTKVQPITSPAPPSNSAAPEQVSAEIPLETSAKELEEADPAANTDEAPAPEPADAAMKTDSEAREASEADSSDPPATGESDSEAPAPEQALADDTGDDASEETDSTDSTDETPTPEPADAAMQTDGETPEASEVDNSDPPVTGDSDSETPAPEQALADDTGDDASEETDSTDSTDKTPAPEPTDAAMQTDSETPEASGADNSDQEAPAPEETLAEEPLKTNSEESTETGTAANADEAPAPKPADAAMQTDSETPEASEANISDPPASSNSDREAPASEHALADKASPTGETPSHAPELTLSVTSVQTNYAVPTAISTVFKATSTSQAYLPALPKESAQTSYAAPKATGTVSQATSSTPCSKASGDGIEKAEVDAYLKGHNDIRAQHGASPLIWATDLAAAAAKWAENCVWNNSKGQVGAFGENLAAGTNLGAAEAVKMWTDEASKYNPADTNCSSRFTQVVWKATTEVGCSVKTCNNLLPDQPGAVNFHVCEYREPGNVSGKFAENVQV